MLMKHGWVVYELVHASAGATLALFVIKSFMIDSKNPAVAMNNRPLVPVRTWSDGEETFVEFASGGPLLKSFPPQSSCFFRHKRRKESKLFPDTWIAVLTTSATAARMIDPSFISRWCGITQREHINHRVLWQPRCAALCLKKGGEKRKTLCSHVSLPVWQATIHHVDWRHWWVTLFTQCVTKDHVTNYCCWWDNSFGLDGKRKNGLCG